MAKKLYAVKLTKKNLDFLFTTFEPLSKKGRGYLEARLLSRLAALGFWGYKTICKK
jgi:hypothetical protein